VGNPCLRGVGGCPSRAGGWRGLVELGGRRQPPSPLKLLSPGQAGPALAESHPCRIDRHGLLSMHSTRQGISPLRLPPRALSFSQGCCFSLALAGDAGITASPAPRSQGGFLGLGASAESPGGVVEGWVSPGGGRSCPSPPHFCCPGFVLAFFFFKMLPLGS